MTLLKDNKNIQKDSISKKLYNLQSSALKRYQDFFVGRSGFMDLVMYEFITSLTGFLPGAAGILFRKTLYPKLFKKVGEDVLWGRNIVLRHPIKIEIGHRTAIDDNCILDAKGANSDGFIIGDDVMIARDTIIQGKTAGVEIGDRCVIGSQCQLSSAGGIRLGKCVMVAGQCYIGGGRYHTENPNKPMMDQGLYTKGPVIIGNDVWLGAGVTIVDGVSIGKGSFIGAGTIITDDIPDFTIVTPHQKLIKLPRIDPNFNDKIEMTNQTSPESKKETDEKDFVKPINPNLINQTGKTLNADLQKKVLIAVFKAIEEINLQLPKEKRLDNTVDTILFKSQKERNLDSLGIINFIVTTEQKIEEELGVVINLTESDLITNTTNYLQSVGDFADFILNKIA